MESHRILRQLASVALAIGGTALLVYGLLFHVTVISSAQEDGTLTTETVSRAEPVLVQDVTFGQGRPTVKVADVSVEPDQPTTETAQSGVEPNQPTVEVAKQGDASGGQTEKPKPAKDEAPKACPT